MSSTQLFTLPIPSLTSSSKPSGTFTCTTHPSNSQIYILTFSSPPDNRLTTPFLATFLHALDILALRYPPGLLITTSAVSKFYSNGLDLDHTHATPGFLEVALYPLLRRLLTFPMPTLALLNGHAFAGGCLIAMHHDYRVMNGARGYICLNEIDFGMLIDTPLMSAVRQKTRPQTFRSLVLEGKRFTAPKAVEEGLVDAVGASVDEAVEWAGGGKGKERAQGLWVLGKSGVFGRMREEMYRQSLNALRDPSATNIWRQAVEMEKAKDAREAEMRVVAWEGEAGGKKAKL